MPKLSKYMPKLYRRIFVKRPFITLAFLLLGLVPLAASSTAATSSTVTLVVWDWRYFPDNFQPALQAADDIFMATHPNIKIRHVGFPYTPFFVKLRSAMAARKGFDVTAIYSSNFAEQYKDGLLPLGKFVDRQLQKQLLFVGDARAGDPGLHALPSGSYAYFFANNKALFRQAGITKVPTIWSDLLAACDKLKAAGIVPFGGGYKNGYTGALGISYIAQVATIPQKLRFASGRMPWTHPLVRKALDYSLQFTRRCRADDAYGRLAAETAPDFAAKKAALYFSYSPRELESLGLIRALGADLGVLFPAKLPDAKFYPTIDGGANAGWGIAKWTKHSNEAWAYIRFMLSANNQARLWNIGREAPNNIAAIPTPKSPLEATFLKWLKHYRVTTGLQIRNQKELDTFWGRLVAPWGKGDLSTDDLIKQMQAIRDTWAPK
jgi:raffinose/stachyose/melibiose transport system substrate-binding protein